MCLTELEGHEHRVEKVEPAKVTEQLFYFNYSLDSFRFYV